jgi:hypothetical protein
MEIVGPNHDENSATKDFPFIGNFHKTLPHNEYGEVCPQAYMIFKETCIAVDAGREGSFEAVPRGGADLAGTAKFTSPMAGASTEILGPAPKSLDMSPAPGILSASTAAEMTELYWMAALRDLPLLGFQAPCTGTDPATAVNLSDLEAVECASEELKRVFADALEQDAKVPGGLRLRLDLPFARTETGCCKEELAVRASTLFRCGLQDEEYGPIISQFFIRPIPYGTQTIDQRQVPYISGTNFLTNYEDWLRAQNTGRDKFGRDYPTCNSYQDQLDTTKSVLYYPVENGQPVTRYISTIRDLARFVNRDALHQAYFNAALFLLGIGAPPDSGNPYAGNLFTREGGFATLGGPDLLTLVSEVASRALKVVWRQKWLVHRRCRPEVYGGLVQMQFNGFSRADGTVVKRQYGLPSWVAHTKAAKRVLAMNKDQNSDQSETYFLPMAFSAGSPNHPAYGAGHATVAGACVTVLKAWFDESVSLKRILDEAPKSIHDPFSPQGLLQPGARSAGEQFHDPQPYCGMDAERITVGGELNKIASNVAMGRSMGGVHWRSDNTRSLRLGEEIAIEILRKRTMEYAERPMSFSFCSFDRDLVRISDGKVQRTQH